LQNAIYGFYVSFIIVAVFSVADFTVAVFSANRCKQRKFQSDPESGKNITSLAEVMIIFVGTAFG